MRIAFDARWIHSSNLDGVGGYALNLLIHLLKIDTQNQYLIFFDREDRQNFVKRELASAGIAAHRYVDQKIFSANAVFRNLFVLPKILADNRVNIFFSPSCYIPPFFKRYKIVVMVTDLSPIFYPGYWQRACYFLKLVYRFPSLLQIMLAHCDLVIAVSRGLQLDLLNRLNIAKEHVFVIYPGIEDAYLKPAADAALYLARKIYNLPENYILYIGPTDKEKNIDVLIKAYAGLAEETRKKINLVIGGVHSNLVGKELQNLAKSLRVEKQVLFAGYISKNHQPAVLKMAKLFVYPSSYEGFPLKVAEALAGGVPTIAAHRFKLDLGDSFYAVDPTDFNQVFTGINRLLSDPNFYAALQKKGKTATHTLKWETTAQNIKNALNLVGI
jgi:glycosyltransferase involved in cell wall biosynthesis